MLFTDGDYPIAFGTIDLVRDLTRSLKAVCNAGPGASVAWSGLTVRRWLPELRRGRIAAAVVKVVGRFTNPDHPLWGYRGPEIVYAAAQVYLALLPDSQCPQDEARIIRVQHRFGDPMRTRRTTVHYQ